MKVVAYEGLAEAALDIHPHITWLLSQYLSNQVFYTDDKKAGAVLKNLLLRFTALQGKIIQMETEATEIDVDQEAAVFVFTTDTATGWGNAVEALRETLAETIVGAGEYKLEKEAKLAAMYGAKNWMQPFQDTMDWIPVIQIAAAEYWVTVYELEALEEAEALAALKATITEKSLPGCSLCDDCDIPHIDLDGHPFD